MKEKVRFIALPIVLLLIAFLGRLIMGSQGVSYEVANRVFSMVILQIHLALVWGAFARKYKGYGFGAALAVGFLIGLVNQVLIFAATAGSYMAGAKTYFNYPEALGVKAEVDFAQAMTIRATGLAVNCALSTVAAGVGAALSFLIPQK